MLNKDVLLAMANSTRLREVPGLDDTDSKFECPKCFGSHFGSWGEGEREYFCHDEYERGCHWHGPKAECFIYEYSQQTLAAELLEAYSKIQRLEKK